MFSFSFISVRATDAPIGRQEVLVATLAQPALRERARAFSKDRHGVGTGLVIEVHGEDSFRAICGCRLFNFMKYGIRDYFS